MKKLLIASALLIQSSITFAQNDSIPREIQFPLTEEDTETVFCYFNDEWIPGASVEMVPADSISKIDIKDDQYGNRAVFITLPPETFSQLKAKVHEDNKRLWREYPYPVCEFPGGNGKLKEWLDANIIIPEGYEGSERVVVSVKVQPDGTITDPNIIKPSKNNAANAEALRLVNSLPKFRVKYFTPKKVPLRIMLPIRFKSPGTIYIRGSKTK